MVVLWSCCANHGFVPQIPSAVHQLAFETNVRSNPFYLVCSSVVACRDRGLHERCVRAAALALLPVPQATVAPTIIIPYSTTATLQVVFLVDLVHVLVHVLAAGKMFAVSGWSEAELSRASAPSVGLVS